MAGGLCIILAFLGILLPVLPTTPFLLLASACFMRSNPKVHRWMHEHKTLGPLLKNWYEYGAVTKQVKTRGVIFILFSFFLSIYFSPILWVKGFLVVVLIILLSWFLRLPTHELVADSEENH
ncbi:YbaN family protein [Vibrio gallaecicus]|uniref:Inner membrane protein n=1 Tax=Vibrio gallaecicus TaxID=552386 RepID=A0ABV4NB80_9VIBR|nr:YbaN family protein [Vibrio gallaecicus]